MVEEKWVTLSHGRTRYFEGGTGPACILLHGAGIMDGGDSWCFNWDALSQHVRVIAPDFLGWGLGDRFDGEYSFAYLVDFVRELQDALGIERSHVVGHSMGGWVAALLAYESPDRVDKLVLVANGGMAARTLSSMTQFRPPTLEDLEAMWRSRLQPGQGDPRALAERDYRKVVHPGAVEAYQRILNHMNHMPTRERYQLHRRLPHVHAPTLIVWGKHDAVNDISLGESAHRLLPNSRFEVLDCGHSIPAERPDEFNRLVVDFLTR
ncbi:MAG: alpha/beta fold hydrolase [Alicyclobacillaceae bacterium]|nr:alpha/beta fold hydrolase [Alicyclobacillaceae bacterium]